MDSPPLFTPVPDSRDKKKFYFADTPQRRTLVGFLHFLFSFVMEMDVLAIEANCPILPMAVTGSDQFFKRFPHRTQVRITILPPLMPNPGENPLALTDRLMFTLAQGLPEAMRGVYAEMPDGFR